MNISEMQAKASQTLKVIKMADKSLSGRDHQPNRTMAHAMIDAINAKVNTNA